MPFLLLPRCRVNAKPPPSANFAILALLAIPDPKRQTQRLFNRIAPLYARRAFSCTRTEARRDAAWVQPQPHERVLTLACGPATLGLELAPHVHSVYGFDLAEGMLAQACRTARVRRCTNIYFCLADAEHLPLPANNFDVVVCRYSFANFPAPQHIVAEMCRVTRPGGRLAVMEVVGPEDPAQRRRLNRLEQFRSRAPVRILSLTDLLALFYHANLYLLDCHVLCRRQWLQDWLALSEKGQDRRTRQRLQQAVLRIAKAKDADGPLYRESGRWCFYHTVARLLWRK